MAARKSRDVTTELEALNAQHIENEGGRDAFLAVAHTALFAASISFVGDIAPIATAKLKFLLILGWASGVVGLLALTWSFSEASKAIDRCIENVHNDAQPSSNFLSVLNSTALWSFPVSLLALLVFCSYNVWMIGDERQSSYSSAGSITGSPAARTPTSGSTTKEELNYAPSQDHHRGTEASKATARQAREAKQKEVTPKLD